MPRTWVGVLGALVLGVSFAAGCGDDDDGGSAGAAAETSAASTAPASDGAAIVTEAKQKVAEYSKLAGIEFPFPTDTYDPGVHKAAIITGGNGAPVLLENAKHVQSAFKAMGWDAPTIYDGKFAPETQSNLINEAVQRGDDAIVLMAMDVAPVKSAVENAFAKKVPIGCIPCVSGEEFKAKGVIDVSVDFIEQGEMGAWFTIADSNGKAKIASFVEPAYPQTVNRATGYEKIMEQCTTCKFVKKRIVVPAADLATPGPPGFTALLTAQPEGSFDYINTYSDAIGVPMSKTLNQTGRKLKIIGYDADPLATPLIKSDPNYVATVAIPYEYASWAAADNVARQLAGKELWGAILPSALVTKDNIDQYKPYPAPDGDWQGKFAAMWGKG